MPDLLDFLYRQIYPDLTGMQRGYDPRANENRDDINRITALDPRGAIENPPLPRPRPLSRVIDSETARHTDQPPPPPISKQPFGPVTPPPQSTSIDRNPLGTYSPDETGANPIVSALSTPVYPDFSRLMKLDPAGTFRAFSEAKPGQNQIFMPATAKAGMMPSSPREDQALRDQPAYTNFKSPAADQALRDKPARDVDGTPSEGTHNPEHMGGADVGPSKPSPVIPTTGQGGNPTVMQAGDQAGMLGGGGGFLQTLKDNSNLLLALGAGMSGAPTWGQGLSRAFAYAGPASQQDIAQQNQLLSTNALIQAGVPRALAQAAQGDPELRKQLLQSYVEPKYDIKPVESTDFLGQKTTRMLAVNPRDPSDSFYVDAGRPGASRQAAGGAAAGVGGGGGTAEGGGGMSPFAPGINEATFDQTKVGKDYLSQFSPQVQADVQAYRHGMYNATGRQQYSNMIKTVADKYGQDIGDPSDTNKINQRKVYMNDLASPDKGVGKKKYGFQQGLEHFNDIAKNMEKMDLAGAWPLLLGGKYPAQAINAVKSAGGGQTQLITENQELAGKLAREFGKMSGGGGVHEALEEAYRLAGPFKSREEAIGVLKGVRAYMYGSLDTMVTNRDELFPEEEYRPTGSNFIGPKQQAALDNIDRIIRVMEGKEGKTAAPAASATVPKAGGKYVYDPATGGFK